LNKNKLRGFPYAAPQSDAFTAIFRLQQRAGIRVLTLQLHQSFLSLWRTDLRADGLQVTPRLTDADPTVLGESVQQLHPRLQHAVPAIPLGIMEIAVSVAGPFLVEHGGGVLPLKVGPDGPLECPI
jgi:hypothetical protein